MDESGAESMEELHFFYDAQSRPAFVEYNGVKYRYVHNLQGDMVLSIVMRKLNSVTYEVG